MKLGRKSLDKIIIYYFLSYLTFSGLIDIYFMWHVVIIILYIIAFFVYRIHEKGSLIIEILLIFSTSLFLISVFISNNKEALANNFRSSLYSLCAIGILYIINRYNNDLLCRKMFEHIRFFNILLIINIVVLAVQVRHTGFLIKSSWLSANSYYEDHCAGLFGFNATNVLGLYSIYVMMLNLAYIRVCVKNKKKLILLTLLEQIVMAFLSQFNDNTGFYMLIGIFLCVYVYTVIQHNKDLVKRIAKIWKYLLIVIILFIVALNIPVLGDYIKETVVEKIQRVLFYDSYGGASGGSERLAIIRYGLSKKSTMGFGTGAGATKWIQGNTFGFDHFGINSMGSYIIIAGIWFYITYTLLYSEIYYDLLSNMSKKKNYFMKLIIFVVVVIFSIYTTIYNDARTALLVGFISVVIKSMLTENIERDRDNKKNYSRRFRNEYRKNNF